MNKHQFRQLHRTARIGNLGTLACSLPNRLFQWFLAEVYDPRFPHIGDERHQMNGRDFNSMRWGGATHNRLASFHFKRGWLNCHHKPLLRLWVEWKAMQ